MLDAKVKKTIQTAYSQLIESKGLIPRYGQRQMIAEIAKNLGGISVGDTPAPICVIEAGTGTGKTLAYVLAVLPVAQALDLKVIVSTATVALQEQVIFKDLPDILSGCDLQFTLSLAKGRGRYLCLSKLDSLLQDNDSLSAMLDLYGVDIAGDQDDSDAVNKPLYEEMLTELSAGNWDGDRDNWEKPLRETDWKAVTVNEGQCMGPKCSNFRSCYFYKARESLDKADCVVTNHDLVLADLALGGGAILPAPSECIYVFDEAHHLPLKSNNHFSASSRIKSTMTWLESIRPLLPRLSKEQFLAEKKAVELDATLACAQEELNEAWLIVETLLSENADSDSYDDRLQYAFELGVVPDELQELASRLLLRCNRIANALGDLVDTVKENLDEGRDLKTRQSAEQWFVLLGGYAKRAEANARLWSSYASADEPFNAPNARWLSHTKNENFEEIHLSSSPVLAADNLQEYLWNNCAAAVLTSATLSSLGNFDVLKMRAGLPDHSLYYCIPSPFNYAEAATFTVPKIGCEPGNAAQHTDAILATLPKMLHKTDAALMLFSSRRQMLDVLQGLPKKLRDKVLCQDDYQKSQLIKYHRQRVDNGEGSIIFGLSSFAEGIDLPGKYCRHVLIAKIPFAVPNDPIERTLSEWVESQGNNAFMTLAVPDAAFRLVQACGRLLRSETDTGNITLFDERIVSKRYGKAILDSLPPYRQALLVELA